MYSVVIFFNCIYIHLTAFWLADRCNMIVPYFLYDACIIYIKQDLIFW